MEFLKYTIVDYSDFGEILIDFFTYCNALLVTRTVSKYRINNFMFVCLSVYLFVISLHSQINDSGNILPPCLPLCVPVPFSNVNS